MSNRHSMTSNFTIAQTWFCIYVYVFA